MPEYAKIRGSKRQLWIGAFVLFGLSASANLASPLYPHFQHALGMSDPMMTALYATYVLSCLPSLLLFGSAADAFGRKPVLVVSVVLVALGTALFGLTGLGMIGLFMGRVLVGVGLGLGTGAGIALMVEASPARRVWLGSTLATMAFVLGAGAGPILAGSIAQYAEFPLVTPFLVMAGVLTVSTVLVAIMPLHRPFTRQRWRPTWPAVPGPMRVSFNIAAITGFIGWAALGLFLALLPSMAAEILPNSGPLASGLIVGAVLIVSTGSHLLAPKFQPRAAQTIGLMLMGLGAALLLSSNLPSLGAGAVATLMTIAAATTGFGHGLSYWGANSEVDDLTPPRNRAGITAALYLAFYAGAGAPAVIVGGLSLKLGLVEAIMIVTLALLLATIAFIPVPSLALTRIRRTSGEEGSRATAEAVRLGGGIGSVQTIAPIRGHDNDIVSTRIDYDSASGGTGGSARRLAT